MAEIPVAQARTLHLANPNFFRGIIDFGQNDQAVAAALLPSIFKAHENAQFENCFHGAFNNANATSHTKQRLFEWARSAAFVHLPPAHEAGHIEVWGESDDSLTHACRLITVGNPRSEDIWMSVMGHRQDIVTHYRNSFAGGGYGTQVASFVNFVNWNDAWMRQGLNFVGNISQWNR